MSRNIGDNLKGSFLAAMEFFADVLGLNAVRRVESARITSTRLKAMEKPDYLVKTKTVEPAPVELDPFDAAAEEILSSSDNLAALDKLGVQAPPTPASNSASLGRGPKKRTNADMSHFRLAAYVASLTPEEREAQEKALAEKKIADGA